MKNNSPSLFKRLLLTLIAVAIILAGVGVGVHYASAGTPAVTTTAPVAAPRASVVVQTLSTQKVRLWTEFSGRLHAIDYAEIRPEVSGRIMEVRFQDGQAVKQGDILFVIDPRPYAAAEERAEAQLASAVAKVELAKIEETRADNLISSHAIAQSEKDTADNAERVADAERENAEAQLKQAKLDLEHAYVAAPISGRVSRAEMTVGNLVQIVSSSPLLTSIVSQDGIYADFEVDEQTYLQTIHNSANGNAQEQRIPVQLVVQGDKDHVYSGFIQSFDNRLDVTSGTIRARAKFDNAGNALIPGMFVSVRLAGSQDREALLVADRAVSFDQSKKFVFVVDASNKVAYREVQLGKQVFSQRVVEGGLEAGDRVIVDGMQHVRPDDIVDAREMTPDSSLVATGKNDQVAKTGGAQ